MKLDNVLLVYKKSFYESSFWSNYPENTALTIAECSRIERVHKQHYESLGKIQSILTQQGIPFHAIERGSQLAHHSYDLIISVGGDGTFIDAARKATHQLILGINSVPTDSVGALCTVNISEAEELILSIIKGTFFSRKLLQRLTLKLNSIEQSLLVLNDILLVHQCPASMSRYWIQIGTIEEEHHGSGLWISTATGSTGAIRSAGGKPMSLESKKIQYLPRELFYRFEQKYRLTGGIIEPQSPIIIGSMMFQGVIYVDGAHVSFPFPLGSKLEISTSSQPLHVISSKGQANRL